MASRRNPEKKMKLSGHFRELRNRLFKAGLAIVAGTVFGWLAFDKVFAELQKPIIAIAKDANVNAQINFGSVVSAFDLHMQIAFFIGLFVASPIWLYQIWAFLSPALRKKDRRYAVVFVLISSPLFLGGAYFGWWLFPGFVRSFLAFTPEGSANMINAAEYVLFTVRVLLVFGIAFVLPAILVLLNALGTMSGKTILKGWRPAIFLISLIGAIATPVSDPMSMFLLMIPLIAFFYLSAGIALLNDKRRAIRQKNVDEVDLVTNYVPDEVQ
ncbi:MAG: twin-arginine translocase subunit TatC [Micrococcales bacterium]|jgi:sec-independent protein translocase protein TatC|nr:twin-arginine translocase subunit TatC [Micrococcales bacterium]NBS61052.1 twin-arginine translocase subunit TatC [Microbacteriaceae bacterium]NBX94623.1 twin-arginine translocase subunit TatC [Actinomycetota bacterium]NBS85807.1 twin-arginine translocase subunit TatC [Micrococcales bacterium]NDC18841.1 twin-arginine translocase subunit TatC [Microbacteriaceae bacterium]